MLHPAYFPVRHFIYELKKETNPNGHSHQGLAAVGWNQYEIVNMKSVFTNREVTARGTAARPCGSSGGWRAGGGFAEF